MNIIILTENQTSYLNIQNRINKLNIFEKIDFKMFDKVEDFNVFLIKEEVNLVDNYIVIIENIFANENKDEIKSLDNYIIQSSSWNDFLDVVEEQLLILKEKNRLIKTEKKELEKPVVIVKKEKEIQKVEIVKEVPIYTNIQNKNVAVLNVNKSAGSTFITLALAKSLANRNVPISVIEDPLSDPDIYDYIGVDQEDIDNEFISIPHLIEEGKDISNIKKFKKQGIQFIIKDPRKKNIENWQSEKMSRLINLGRNSTFTIIDFNSHFFNEYIDIELIDIIIAVIDPLPTKILKKQSQEAIRELEKLREKGKEVYYILNKYHKGIKIKEIKDFLDIKITDVISYQNHEIIYKNIYNSKIHEMEELERITNIFLPINMKDENEKKHKKNKLFKLIIKNK